MSFFAALGLDDMTVAPAANECPSLRCFKPPFVDQNWPCPPLPAAFKERSWLGKIEIN